MDIFQSIKDDPIRECPECHEPALVRQIGRGAGLIFKGTGFYETDYKKSSTPASESSKAPAKSDPAPKADGAKAPAPAPSAAS